MWLCGRLYLENTFRAQLPTIYPGIPWSWHCHPSPITDIGLRLSGWPSVLPPQHHRCLDLFQAHAGHVISVHSTLLYCAKSQRPSNGLQALHDLMPPTPLAVLLGHPTPLTRLQSHELFAPSWICGACSLLSSFTLLMLNWVLSIHVCLILPLLWGSTHMPPSKCHLVAHCVAPISVLLFPSAPMALIF